MVGTVYFVTLKLERFWGNTCLVVLKTERPSRYSSSLSHPDPGRPQHSFWHCEVIQEYLFAANEKKRHVL